jgi:hypothetical protein
VRLDQWRRAGFSLAGESLSFAEWQALAVIARRQDVKDLEALCAAAAGSAVQ